MVERLVALIGVNQMRMLCKKVRGYSLYEMGLVEAMFLEDVVQV
jgi:hypothetical protein